MSLHNDAKTALRSLGKSPGFTLFATLALAAGIGLTLYMFGAINAFVLRPLPFRDADRMIHLELSDPALDDASIEVPYPDFLTWRSELGGVSDLAAYYEGTLNLADSGAPERLDGLFATGELFDVLGARAALGRPLTAADSAPGAPPVVVISRLLWERRYGSDPSVVGRAVRVNGRAATIVGVMPAEFRFPRRTEAWTTIPESAAAVRWQEATPVEVVGHMASGSRIEALGSELDAALAQAAKADTTRSAGLRAVVKPLADEYVGRDTRKQLDLMFLAVVLVLLIACANVANLLYARGLGRQRDLAVRAALGASRRRLVLYGLSEALVVCLAAAALGMVLAQWAGSWTMESLRTNEDMDIPSWVRFETDARSVAFTLAIAFAAALAAGLAPALAGSRPDVQKELRSAGRGGAARSRRALRVLVVAQIALCCALVTCAGLAARSISKLYAADLGVEETKILGGRVALFEESYPTEERQLDFFVRAEERLRQLPGVVSATVTTSLPGTFIGAGRIEIEGGKLDPQRSFSQVARISPSYFETLGLALLSGRAFSATDDASGERTAIVNRKFVERYFPGEEPLGKRFRPATEDGSAAWLRVVGVCPDLVQDDLEELPAPTYYLPIAQETPRFAFLAVRTAGDAAALKESMRKVVAGLDPDQPVYYLRTLDEWNAIVRWSNRFLAGVFVVFAFAGLVLAAIGVYGMSAYAVAQRTAEIGVRRALGAVDRSVIRLVAGRSARDLAWGLGLGLLFATALAQPVSSMFYDVDAFDLPTFVAVPLVLLFAVALATLIPARRALRIQPAAALRQE